MRIRERDADPSCGLCRFRGGDAVESFHASAADFADFTGRRCGSLGCGLCKILRGLCNLPGADHPGGHAELQQPMPTTDANRSIQHSRLRHAGMPPVRRHVIWRHGHVPSLDRLSRHFISQLAPLAHTCQVRRCADSRKTP